MSGVEQDAMGADPSAKDESGAPAKPRISRNLKFGAAAAGIGSAAIAAALLYVSRGRKPAAEPVAGEPEDRATD
jgi:hypothetical protein